MPVTAISLQLAERRRYLSHGRFELLQTDHVRPLALDPFKNLSPARTDPVNVPSSDFQTSNRSRTIKDGIAIDENALARLRDEAAALLAPFFDERENPRDKAFRLIGLRVEKLF